MQAIVRNETKENSVYWHSINQVIRSVYIKCVYFSALYLCFSFTMSRCERWLYVSIGKSEQMLEKCTSMIVKENSFSEHRKETVLWHLSL